MGRLALVSLSLSLLAPAPLALAAGTGASSHDRGQVIDRIVAVVDGQVLTLSGLEFEARVALIEQGGAAAASAPLDEAALHSALQWSVAQRVETSEADRLHAFTVEDSEVAARLSRFQSRFEGHDAYERFLASQEVDEPQLAEVLARAIRAEKVLDSKVRLKARVTEDAVRAYYDAHLGAFPEGFEKARAAIRDRLMRARYQTLVQEELAQQRAGSNVRILVPFTQEVGR